MSQLRVNQSNQQKRVPVVLVFIASLFVISAIAVSNMPEWNMAYRGIAAVFVFTYVVFFLLRRI